MIDCKKIASQHKSYIKELLQSIEYIPTLAVIQVGNNAASNSYIKGKKSDCEEVGINFVHYKFEEDCQDHDILNLIDQLNLDENINGIIVQMPLPEHMDKERILCSIADGKDVDGFKPNSKFTPCTPMGVMTILQEIGIDVDGEVCCVIGRGEVGRPMVNLLAQHNATVIWCNSHTNKYLLDRMIDSANIIISATGQAGLIQNVPNYKVVIDVGISRGEDGKLYGDVDKSNYSEDALITSVPGGVGLMTRVSLLENVVSAAKKGIDK